MATGKGRGRPPKSKTEKRAKQVNIRLTADELVALEQEAAVTGRSVSDLVRQWVLGRTVAPKVDLLAINELRRQGGNLRDFHLKSNGIYRIETKAALAALQAAIERIARP